MAVTFIGILPLATFISGALFFMKVDCSEADSPNGVDGGHHPGSPPAPRRRQRSRRRYELSMVRPQAKIGASSARDLPALGGSASVAKPFAIIEDRDDLWGDPDQKDAFLAGQCISQDM